MYLFIKTKAWIYRTRVSIGRPHKKECYINFSSLTHLTMDSIIDINIDVLDSGALCGTVRRGGLGRAMAHYIYWFWSLTLE